jgi:xanthine dehydrogenase iron-sulfur cluster and FAD-binding subunit A
MRRFNIVEPRSIDDACKILAEDEDAKLIGGGTALLILIKHGILLPQTLVNLKKIKGATEIAYDPMNGLRVGGLASIYDVESAPAVRQHYPLLAEACRREYPYSQHGDNRRQLGPCRLAVRSASGAGGFRRQRGAEQTRRQEER